MRIILKEYLSSLKERGDLDRFVIPNLLAEIGLNVISTPLTGARQYGVDIAAVGKIKDEDSEPHLYLFCVKAGNISRNDWDTGAHSVRTELTEILDVYIQNRISPKYASLPIKICLCCGGEIEETVRDNWVAYQKRYATEKVTYEEWNGDRIADFMVRCLLARELLEVSARKNFQKSVAMINEPTACYKYARAFLMDLLTEDHSSNRSQLFKLRQSYICLHAIIAWAVDEDNLESAYKVAELGVLLCWNAVRSNEFWKKQNKQNVMLVSIFDQFAKLFLSISDRYLNKTAYAHCEKLHVLSAAVHSKEAVDVNLALFELLGRLAIHGIWSYYISKKLAETNDTYSSEMVKRTNYTVSSIVSLINSNPTLNSPIRDDHMIEICLVIYLASLTNRIAQFTSWVRNIADFSSFALRLNGFYPTRLTDYADLLNHPVSGEQSYRDKACAGSVLYPVIFHWMKHIAEKEKFDGFTERLRRMIPDCTHQAWFPDEETDKLIWRGETYHGICVSDLSPNNGYDSFSKMLKLAIDECKAIEDISAIKADLVQVFLMACRHYRLPIPPVFWFIGT